ncbi:hypothetical protein FKM82_023674 [Ascaphus truei]
MLKSKMQRVLLCCTGSNKSPARSYSTELYSHCHGYDSPIRKNWELSCYIVKECHNITKTQSLHQNKVSMCFTITDSKTCIEKYNDCKHSR